MKKLFNYEISDKNWKLLVELKNVVLTLLILIDFLFIIIITFFNVSYSDLYFMALFDLMICILLFIQLCYEYLHYELGFKSFVKGHLTDILAIIPFNFIFLRYLAVFRVARLLQFFQIFKVFNIKNSTSGSLKFFIQNGLLKIMIIIVFLYLMFSSVALKQIDPAFTSVFEAFWFNLVTITSVGYGELTPVTDPGKVIAMFSIVIGIMFVSIFTAAMSGVYMEKPEMETRKNFKQEMKKYIGKLEEENVELHKKIGNLEEENKLINDKLDRVLNILEENDDET